MHTFTFSHSPMVKKLSEVLYLGPPFGFYTAPMEFTSVVKEVQLTAQARGIRI